MNDADQPKLDLRRVLELLAALDEQLGDGPPITLLAGGGVAMMTVVRGRLSVDVDVLERTINNDLMSAVAAVAEREGLAADWLNNDAARFVPEIGRADRSVLFEGRRLTLEILGLEVLLAMKLLAGREKDMDDTITLMERTGITTEEEMHELIEECFGHLPHLAPDFEWAFGNVSNACDEYEARRLSAPPGAPSLSI